MVLHARRFTWIFFLGSFCLFMVPSVSSNVTAPAPAAFSDLEEVAAVEEKISYAVRVNIPERRLRVHAAAPGATIDDLTPVFAEYRIAVGLKRHPTPVMDAAVVSKRSKPAWYVPRTDWAGELAGQVIPFSSRENPFRARNAAGRIEGYFIALGRHGIGFHSTRESRSIGRLASHGCIRMNLDDIRALYRLLPLGTPVSIVYQLYRIEEHEGGLRILAFEDVYHRFGRERRATELERHLARHGLGAEILRPEERESLLAGRSVELAGVSPHRIVFFEERETFSEPDAPAVRAASEILARTILAMPR